MIVYCALRLAILVFGYLPFGLLYRISDVLAFVFYHTGIRKKTIVSNLQQAFPEQSTADLKQITHKVYQNFFDVMFVEMIKSFTLSSKKLAARFHPGDVSLLEHYQKQNKSVIVVLGHYANWEWGVCVDHAYHRVAFYKPLKNRYIDQYVRRNRARHHFELASIYKPLSTFLKLRNTPSLYFLIADKQNVKQRHAKRVVWLPFLGRESPFLLGPETYARSFNYPVLYSQIRRVGRGRYQHQLIEVADNPAEQPMHDITKTWVALLEQQVLEDPSAWFWFWAATRSRQLSGLK